VFLLYRILTLRTVIKAIVELITSR
jgi:hypothetical protein